MVKLNFTIFRPEDVVMFSVLYTKDVYHETSCFCNLVLNERTCTFDLNELISYIYRFEL